MFVALFSAFMNAAENIFDKVILKEKGVTYKHFLPIMATAIFLISLTLFPFLGKISADFFTQKYLFVFVGMIFVAFFYNILFFYAMSKENLCDVEPFVLIDRPVTVLLAAAFFPSERSLIPIIFTLVAAITLIASRVEKHHLKIKKNNTRTGGFCFINCG